MAAGDNDEAGGTGQSRTDHTSPFYLGPQDRPGDFITPVRLTGDNYDAWANAVRLSLRTCRKYVFVDGTITGPVAPWTQEDWLTIQYMIVSWLLNTISPEVKCTLSQYEDPRVLWNDLQERYSAVDGPKIPQVKTDLAKCTQTRGMNVGSYYAKLKILWDELNNYEPIITCTCGNCKCDVAKQSSLINIIYS
ncbi:unnamed protein product [Cuscuta epithymum]|uniref:Retrotransposon Copia-like N-terminal domain-containing protein n=1 Tax=Cuscuta epithymum TaxID=186058 RepID=A0AAV0G7H4_9ASTE|nr:unnamed protein product [Cuscuta epithymum]